MAIDAFTLQIFRDEALEHLGTLEQALLGLNPAQPDSDLIDSAFRALHTIKGSGAMFGLDRLVEFSHLAESLFSRLRDKSLMLNQDLIDLGLRAKDFLHLLLPGSEASDSEMAAGMDIRDAISALLPGKSGGKPVQLSPSQASSDPESSSGIRSWRIRFKPGQELFKSGTNPLQLLKDLGELGTSLVLGYCSDIPPLEEMDPEACYFSWEILIRSGEPEASLRDVFIFVESDSSLDYHPLDEGIPGPDDLDQQRLAQILTESGQLVASLGSQEQSRALEDWLAAQGFINADRLKAFRSDLEYLQAARDPRVRRERESTATIKVATIKLDAMVNMIGELVTLQSRYLQLAEDRQDQDLNGLNENLEAMTRNLRGLAMEMHMVPLELLFSSYQRLIRDLGRQLGKQVVLETAGTETELEKNIMEELKDPLLHLIRNAMDHGIETPVIREACGKDPTGHLKLSARYEGASVIINVDDDGNGLDTHAIARKAIERQLISSAAGLSENDIHQLIFVPGFSTASTISDISGRGVGMDVVKRSIENLRGSIRLDSQPGLGTSIQLRIPLSLSVIEALLLRVGGTPYALNLGLIKECRDWAGLRHMNQGTMVIYQDEPVPCVNLAAFFDPVAALPDGGVVVFIGEGKRTVGLLVDEVRNTIQAVIKPLGKSFAASRGVNGAVVLGDGSLALVIDAEHFLAMHGTRLM